MRILVAGVVSAYGLGDLLQYYLALKLVKKYLPRSEVYLAVSEYEFAKRFSNIEQENVVLLPSLLDLATLTRIFPLTPRTQNNTGSSKLLPRSSENSLITKIFKLYHESRLAPIQRAIVLRKVFGEKFTQQL